MDNEDKALNEVLSSFSTGDLVMEIRDRIGNRITFAVAALCAILLIDMFMGLI